MLANGRPNRGSCHLFLGLALGIPCLITGCGDGGSDKPAPIGTAQTKKAQEYMANYHDQIIAANKAKAAAKAAAKASAKASAKAAAKASAKAPEKAGENAAEKESP